jgi:hypothetical protein
MTTASAEVGLFHHELWVFSAKQNGGFRKFTIKGMMVSNSDIDIYQTYQTYQTRTFLPTVLQGFIHPGMIHGNVISPVVGVLEDLSPEVEVPGIQEFH